MLITKIKSVMPLASESSNRLEIWRKSLPVIVCFAIPGMMLLGAYIHMAIFYKKLWLFDTVVHERGKYTLLEVIFYFRHFLWEVLIKSVYSVFVVGAFLYYGKPMLRTNESSESNIPVNRIVLCGVLALSLVFFSIFMSGREVGFKDAMMGLLQYRTHELRPLVFGSHWRNHFLSNIVLFCTSICFILVYRMLTTNGFRQKRRYSIIFPISVFIFVGLTFFFGITLDPFQTPSYLGHQLREIFGTDLSITMFLVMGVLIYLENKYDTGSNFRAYPEKEMLKGKTIHIIWWALPAVGCSAFLIVKVLTLDIGGEIGRLGHTNNWSVPDLFAWHFFEHWLDYIYTVLLVWFIYLSALKTEQKGTRN